MAIPKAGAAPLDDLGRFLVPFAALVRRAESRHALERYTTGLLSDLARKTASALGRSLPGTNGQRLQEWLTRTSWEPREMDRLRVAHMLREASVGDGVVIVDDTGFAKKGTHSVGVARQYSGTLGRVDNCQVVVTAHYVDRVFDWPITARLYLPASWTTDRRRRRQAQVPRTVRFQTKGEIALDLLDFARATGIAPRAAVLDPGYGDQPTVLHGLEARQLPYVVGVGVVVRFRRAAAVEADSGERVVPRYSGRGRPRRPRTLSDRVPPETCEALRHSLPPGAWRNVAWREGTKGALVKECARLRVYRTGQRGQPLPSLGWLLCERPLPGHAGDPKQYFVWGLDTLSLEELIELAHVRWVVERFYQDAKGELGMDDYEGRLWMGWHRHLALVMLAHSYLTLRQSYGPEILRPPPPGTTEVAAGPGSAPPLARGFPPSGTKKHRGAPARRAGRTVPAGHRVRRSRAGSTINIK